jgi:LPS O-antigen subunit length determinant protein (WzzB/FepE family)
MTTEAIIAMVLILGFVWGGLAVLVTTAMKKEKKKST